MADEKVSVTGPVEIKQTSKEFVALELMNKIAQYDDTKPKDRKYWLTLTVSAGRQPMAVR